MNVSCPECRSVFRVDPTKIPALGLRARCSVCGGVITIGAGSSIDEEFAPASPSVGVSPAPARSGSTMAPAMATSAPPMHAPPAAPVAPLPLPPLPAPRVSAPIAAESATGRPVVRPIAPPRATPPGRPAMFPPRPATGTSSASPLPPSAAGNVRPSGFAPRPTAPAAPPARTSGAIRPSGPSQAPASPPDALHASASTPTRTPINPFLANDPNAKARRLSRALVSDLVTYFPQRRDEGLRDGTLKDLFREEIKKSYEEYVDQVGKEFAESTTHFQDALNEILAGGQRLF